MNNRNNTLHSPSSHNRRSNDGNELESSRHIHHESLGVVSQRMDVDIQKNDNVEEVHHVVVEDVPDEEMKMRWKHQNKAESDLASTSTSSSDSSTSTIKYSSSQNSRQDASILSDRYDNLLHRSISMESVFDDTPIIINALDEQQFENLKEKFRNEKRQIKSFYLGTLNQVKEQFLKELNMWRVRTDTLAQENHKLKSKLDQKSSATDEIREKLLKTRELYTSSQLNLEIMKKQHMERVKKLEELWTEDRKNKDAAIDSLNQQVSQLKDELQKVELESNQNIEILNKENEIKFQSELEKNTIEMQNEVEKKKLEYEKSIQDLELSFSCKEKIWQQEAMALREGVHIAQIKLDESIQKLKEVEDSKLKLKYEIETLLEKEKQLQENIKELTETANSESSKKEDTLLKVKLLEENQKSLQKDIKNLLQTEQELQNQIAAQANAKLEIEEECALLQQEVSSLKINIESLKKDNNVLIKTIHENQIQYEKEKNELLQQLESIKEDNFVHIATIKDLQLQSSTLKERLEKQRSDFEVITGKLKADISVLEEKQFQHDSVLASKDQDIAILKQKCSDNLNTIEQKSNVLRERELKYENTIEILRQNITTLEGQISSLKSQNQEALQKSLLLESTINSTSEDLKSEKTKTNELQASLDEYVQLLNTIKSEKDALMNEASIQSNKYNNEITNLNRIIQDVNSNLLLCKKEVSSKDEEIQAQKTRNENLMQSINDLNKDFSRTKEEKFDLEQQLRDATMHKEKQEQREHFLEKKLAEIQEKLHLLQSENITLDQKYSRELHEKEELHEKFNQKLIAYDKLFSEYQELGRSKKELTSEYTTLQEKLQSIQASHENCEEELRRLQSVKVSYDQIQSELQQKHRYEKELMDKIRELEVCIQLEKEEREKEKEIYIHSLKEKTFEHNDLQNNYKNVLSKFEAYKKELEEYEQFKKKHNSQSTELAILQKSNEEKENKIWVLEAEMLEMKGELISCRQQLESIERNKHISSSLIESEIKQKLSSSFEMKVQEVERIKESATQEVKEMRSTILEKEKIIDNLNSLISEMEQGGSNALEEKDVTIMEQEEIIRELQQELAQLQNTPVTNTAYNSPPNFELSSQQSQVSQQGAHSQLSNSPNRSHISLLSLNKDESPKQDHSSNDKDMFSSISDLHDDDTILKSPRRVNQYISIIGDVLQSPHLEVSSPQKRYSAKFEALLRVITMYDRKPDLKAGEITHTSIEEHTQKYLKIKERIFHSFEKNDSNANELHNTLMNAYMSRLKRYLKSIASVEVESDQRRQEFREQFTNIRRSFLMLETKLKKLDKEAEDTLLHIKSLEIRLREKMGKSMESTRNEILYENEIRELTNSLRAEERLYSQFQEKLQVVRKQIQTQKELMNQVRRNMDQSQRELEHIQSLSKFIKRELAQPRM